MEILAALGLLLLSPEGAGGFPPGGSLPLHTEIVRVYGEIAEGSAHALLVEAGTRVVDARGREPAHLRYSLLDSEIPLAFALPGGFVYVSRTGLRRIQRRAALDALLERLLSEATKAEATRTQRDALYWAPYRGIGWPARDGPAGLLRDRVETAVRAAMRRLEQDGAGPLWPPAEGTGSPGPPPDTSSAADTELRARFGALPAGPNPLHGRLRADGRFEHPALGGSLAVPAGWTARGGARIADLRSPTGDTALELVAFPLARELELDALVDRSLAELGRERGLDVRDVARSAGELAGLRWIALDYTLVRRGTETPARCLWLRARSHVYRLLATATLEAHWADPERLRRIQSTFELVQPDSN